MTTIIFVFIFIFLPVALLISGIKKIPVLYVGQITRLGRRVPGEYRKEGWTYLLFYPWYTNVILIDMQRQSFDVVEEKALTPDKAESRVPILVTWRPLESRLNEYINSKEKAGVEALLTGKIKERIREWCMGDEEGPATWEELNKSRLEGTSILVTKIAHNSLEEIPEFAQEVPTWIWLRYYTRPQPRIPLENEKIWSENDWLKVKEKLALLNTTEISELEKSVKKRRDQIEDLRNREGKIVIGDLGIQLEGLNMEDVDVLGEVAKKAESEAKEKQERLAEMRETETVLELIDRYMAAPYNFSKEKALEAVQTERGKVPKTIHEHKLNISSESSDLITEIAKLFIKK